MPKKKDSPNQNLALPVQLIENRIYLIRGHKVMLDQDLAELYEIDTKVLNQAVKRNLLRFPEDFMFMLTPEESDSLRSQIVTSKVGRGGRRYLPYAFTQEGIAMLSSVLHSERAIQVNIAIMRAFVKLRQFLITNEELAKKVDELQQSQLSHSHKLKQHDDQIRVIFEAIKKIIKAQIPPKDPSPNQTTKRLIGFTIDDEKKEK